MSEPSSLHAAVRVLRELKRRAKFGYAESAIRELASTLGLGRSTVSRALNVLAAEGAITKQEGGTGDGYPTIWRIEGRPDALVQSG